MISRHGVEREIAVALSRDVAFEDAPFTRDGIASYVDSVMAGIRSPPELSFAGPPTLIADNFFNSGCVLGEQGLATTRSRGAHGPHAHQQSGGRSRRRRHVSWSSARSAGLARQFPRSPRVGPRERRVRVSGKPCRDQMARCCCTVPIEIEALGSLEIAVSG